MLDREPADIKSNGMSLVELCSEGHVRVASHQLLQKLEEQRRRSFGHRIGILRFCCNVF